MHETQYFGDLAGVRYGTADGRPPLVLLHGITYDRRQWGLREEIGLEVEANDLGHPIAWACRSTEQPLQGPWR